MLHDRGVAEQRASASLVPSEHEYARSAGTTGKKLWGSAWRARVVVAAQVLVDALVALLIWGAAYLLQGIWGIWEITGGPVTVVASGVAVWVGLRALMGLYPGYGLDAVEDLRRHTYSALATLGIMTTFTLGLGAGGSGLLPLVAVFAGSLLLAPPGRYLVIRVMRRFGIWGRPVVVLSYKDTGGRFLELLEREWGLGYDPVALFDYHLKPAGAPFEEISYGNMLTDAADLARERGIDTVIFATPHTRREQLAGMVSLASKSFRYVLVVPNLGGITNSAVMARYLGGTLAVEIKQNLLDPWSQRVKRALDLFGAVVGGLLMIPLIFATALLIKLDSQGPAFYSHRRLGSGDTHFACWKFRTMHANSERLLEEYLQNNPELQAEWEQNRKLRKDPRVTRVGQFLRKTSLDELPQLWNVLRGEMSLVGPRPIVDDEVPKYGEEYELYTRIRPGMSGFWQVNGRSDTDYDERVEMDSYYVRDWSVWLDVILLVRTVKVVLLSRGAY